jgi:hypothetical protein
MAIYDIDLLRALFDDKLNDNTIFLASFYEQIQDDQQIERYVETIKELLALQNREKSESNYKAMGIIAQSGNAEIINIKQNYISPLEYQARFDIELSDRDYVLGKLKTLINDLRGRKFDLIQLANGTTKVITPNIINTTTDKLQIRLGGTSLTTQPNFMTIIGSYDPTSATTLWSNDIDAQFHNYPTSNPFANTGIDAGFWFVYNNKLYYRTLRLLSPPSSYSYGTAVEVGTVDGLYKLSLSFDGIQSQEPYINNGVDRVFLFFGGSATVVESKVSLGNDIVLNTIQVGKNTGTIFTVEPTEIPASLSVSDDTFQTYANGYRTQDRNLAIGNKMAYSFIYDNTITLYNDLYVYARFGTNAGTALVPGYAQQVFTIKEYRYSFGVLTTNTFFAKLGDVATSNTNGDVMTLSVNFKIGDY